MDQAPPSLPSFVTGLPLRIALPPRRASLLALLVLVAALFGAHACAGRTTATLPNLAIVTAGGNQLWADVAWDDGWRVQEHVWTGHGRLLDGDDVRRAWGSVEDCRRELLARRARGEAAPAARPVAVVLHGLWRTRDAMAALTEGLRADGYDVIDVAYPSTRRRIDEHAAVLAGLLDGLPGEQREVSFVTHSLGALVTRALLARSGDPWRSRHRLGRAVFIAPPHTGAAMAELGARIPGALAVYGAPSREIAAGYAERLPAPPLPFLDIAAVRGDEGGDGWNPWIPGEDDGVVGVSETHLEGEAAHATVRGSHTFVMAAPEVVERTREFLAGDR